MRIEFERTGGLMGMNLAVTVKTDEVPAESGRALREMVTAADFFNLPPRSLSDQSQPDQFHYELTVEDAGRRHTIEMDETAVPENLRPLIMRLVSEARRARRRDPE